MTKQVQTIAKLIDKLKALGNDKRLGIIEYCIKPQSFTQIIFRLRLNPASFKFHAKILIDSGLLKRIERGKYETTRLGEFLFNTLLKYEGRCEAIALKETTSQ